MTILTEIRPNIFLNKITLPDTPLKYLNSYIIKDGGRPLIVDTGFNCRECEDSFFDGLAQLSIDPAEADVLVTHLHSDHSGLICQLQERGANIMIGEEEAPSIIRLAREDYWERMDELVKLYDLAKHGIKAQNHPGYNQRPGVFATYQGLADGQMLTYGRYRFVVRHVPGHTTGHIALYEADQRLIISGDLVLDTITPTITFVSFTHDILETYLNTLKQTRDLPIDLMLTGHRELIADPERRIDQMFAHHQRRLDEIKSILAGGEKSVADTASFMTWSIKARSWTDFPKPQKWFASGEAMAHLEYLYHHKIVKRRKQAGVALYSPR